MNGVETAQHARVERRCRIEKLFVDLHDVQPLQESSCPGECRGTVATDRAKDRDASEGAGGSLGFVTKIAAGAEDSGSAMTSFTNAEESRYTTASTAPGTGRE